MMLLVKPGRLVSVAVVVVALLLTVGVGRSGAAVPWWHLNTVSALAGTPGGEGILLVEASDLGDAYVNGSANPVTVVDTLPAGVIPLHVYGEGGGKDPVRSEVVELTHCSFVAQVVTCTYDGPLLEYERLMIAIVVGVEPGKGTGINEASVSGGGAAPVVLRRALALTEGGLSFGTEDYEVTPEEEGGALDTQAGSHPFQLTSTLTFNTKTTSVWHPERGKGEEGPEVQPVALTKELRFDLPPGLVGNPTPLAKCSMSLFTRNANLLCPEEAVVGVSTSIVTNTSGVSRVPLAETVPLFNLEPAAGEPARFGFETPAGPVVLDTSIRTGGDYGVVVSVPDIPDDLGFIGAQTTFWGVPADSRHDTARGPCLDQQGVKGERETACPLKEKLQPFLIMPTSCTGSLQTSVEGESWAQIGRFTEPFSYTFQNGEGEPYGLDGCGRLSFEPSIDVTPDGQEGSTPTGLTVGVHVDQQASLNPAGLADSTVRDTTVTLPAGVALNPAGGDGLLACGLGSIGLQSAVEQSCPEASKVATVEIETPLLPHKLEGAAYLATQEANPFGSLIAMYLVVRDPVSGVLVKLAGEVKPDPATGQLVSTFDETPQLPFENLRLHFFGGSRAPLATSALCGSYTTTASIVPWSGDPAANVVSSPFEIVSGPNGSPCSDPLPFGPSLTAGSLNLQAGAFTTFTTTMSRGDGEQTLDALALHMPPGLSGLLAGVKLCGEAQANAGTCGPESLIGETTVSVGLGDTPFSVKGGRVYITGPYEGAPFGLSIVNPAKAGPFDLENTRERRPACDCVLVRARIEVDPVTAALTVTSDSTGPYRIPTILEGIPLQIKHVNVTINRPGFTFNSTDCNPLAITGGVTSSQGTTSSLSVPFQVTNCATLKFKPGFKASTTGHTSRALGASLTVKLTYPKAPFGSQANIKSVKVDLPKQLPSQLKTLQQACAAAKFDANPASCPAVSIVGHAKATTPLLPVPLQGPAYFVSNGGAKFPELVIVLQGYGVTVDLHGETFINEHTITSSTFHTVPDVPVGTFELNLPQGKFPALAANGNLCKVKGGLRMPTMLTAQNGATIKQSTHISVTGCPKTKASTNKHNKH
jgi:hypothetical protein